MKTKSANPIQTFPLVIGETYKIIPPRVTRLGVIYLTSIAKLMEVSANGRARFETRVGETFTIPLSDNRIFKY